MPGAHSTGLRLRSPLYAVGGEEILDDAEDSLLFVAGQFADFLEDAACLADGAALSLNGVLPGEEIIHGNIEYAGGFGDVIGPEGGGAAFPAGIGGLGDAEFFGQLRLRQTHLLPGGEKFFAERGPRKFCGASGCHGDSVVDGIGE
jgi:hypothetical protein